MRVRVTVEEVELDAGDSDHTIDGMKVCCGRCCHEVEVFGTEDSSIKRGCVMLREECPKKENNFYTT